MRFSLKKCWTTCSPRPSPPSMALSGTRTLASETCAWSVGMLKVHRYSSTVTPGAREIVGPLLLLFRAAVVEHQQQRDVVPHDRVLVLQVAVQAESLAGQVLAD